MRKNLLVLGIFLLFLGVIITSGSRFAIRQEPIENWVVVKEVRTDQPTRNLSVQGDLIQGDKFRVYFSFNTPAGQIPREAAVQVNLTDPKGNTTSYLEPIGGETASYPEGVANQTGTYEANAMGLAVSLYYLAIEKMELKEKEPLYPYSNLAPVGIVVFLGGVGVSLIGAKTSERKRVRRQRRQRKHKLLQAKKSSTLPHLTLKQV